MNVSIRYQVILANLDGETQPMHEDGYYWPAIPMDRVDDQLTPQSAIIAAQQWFDENGWTGVTIPDTNRGNGYATAPDGQQYQTQLFEMRCGTYTLRYLDEKAN